MKAISIIILVLAILLLPAWGYNLVKLTRCDLRADYSCEIIHGAGLLIIPAALVTVWFADDTSTAP